MATPGKYRQQKYKERLRAMKKKEVAVNLSKKSYEILVKKKKGTGKSYAEIIDESLMGNQEPEEILRNIPMETGKELHDILTYFENLKKKHVDESLKHTRNVFQSLDTSEVVKKHDDTSGRYFNDLLEHSYDTIYRFNYIENRFDYISTSSSKEMSKSLHEFKSMDLDVSLAEYIHPEDLEKVLNHFDLSKKTLLDDISTTIEFRGKVGGKDGTYRWLSDTHKIIREKDNRPVAIIGNSRDITESKELEIELRELIDKLERKITDYASNLEQTNTALTVLLKKYEEGKKAIEDNILFNINEQVYPLLETLQKGKLTERQMKIFHLLKSSLKNIVSPFSNRLAAKYVNLSNIEAQVASYILHGKTTKEIAEVLCLSDRTIEFHRTRIRKKIGLTNSKTTLRSYLLSLQ